MAKQRSREFWEKALEDYERVSQVETLTTFARSRGIVPGSLYRWRAKLALERNGQVEPDAQADSAPPTSTEQPRASFVPVVLRERSEAPVVRVQLTNPPTIEILAPERAPIDWLVRLARSLSEVTP